MDLGIKGRRAAVAAASAGLGYASAAALAAEGALVTVCGSDSGRATAAIAQTPPEAYQAAIERSLLAVVRMSLAALPAMREALHRTERVTQVYGERPPLGDVPAGRLGEPAELGAVVAFLCSAHAGYLTGAALPVDGGAYQALL